MNTRPMIHGLGARRLAPWFAAALLAAVGAVVSVADEAAPPAPPLGIAPPPGSIKFVATNAFTTAKGTFKSWKIAKAEINRDAPEKSVVEIQVEIASIDTGIEKRDNHLRTADFFDAAKYPTATILIRDATPKKGAPAGSRVYAAKMDLDLHGVKKTFDIEFEVTAESPMAIKGKVTINRMDFGIGEPKKWYNPGSISEKIPIEFEAVLEPTTAGK